MELLQVVVELWVREALLYVRMERERWRFYLRLWLLILKSAG